MTTLSIPLSRVSINVCGGWKPRYPDDSEGPNDIARFCGCELEEYLKKKKIAFSSEVFTNSFFKHHARKKLALECRIECSEFYNPDYRWVSYDTSGDAEVSVEGFYHCEEEEGICLVLQLSEANETHFRRTGLSFTELDEKHGFEIQYFETIEAGFDLYTGDVYC